MFELRDYQVEAVEETMAYINKHRGKKYPCIVMPTGSGKSLVVADLIRRIVSKRIHTRRVLMLTMSKELISQNHATLKKHWPEAPAGICSNALKRLQMNPPIISGSPGTVVNRVGKIASHGVINVIIIDECHNIAARNEGTYRKIIDYFQSVAKEHKQPFTVIGLTATPFRMGHGYITDKPAIFDDFIEPVTIRQLVESGYLSPLSSKHTDYTIDTQGVKKSGGDFQQGDLQRAVNTEENNEIVACASVEFAKLKGCKKVMYFCAGIDHAQKMSALLNAKGMKTLCVTGKMKDAERNEAVRKFKSGEIQAVTNVNCLSTGFDVPDIDMLVLARPTESPGLYMQQIGRALRIHPSKKVAHILDFAGNVSRHGPITDVKPPKKKGEKGGDAPIKVCPQCFEICHASIRVCPDCGHEFPPAEKPRAKLHKDDIMGDDKVRVMEVGSWNWSVRNARSNDRPMLVCEYFKQEKGFQVSPMITEYLCVFHDGYAKRKGIALYNTIIKNSGAKKHAIYQPEIDQVIKNLNSGTPPAAIRYEQGINGFPQILERIWQE